MIVFENLEQLAAVAGSKEIAAKIWRKTKEIERIREAAQRSILSADEEKLLAEWEQESIRRRRRKKYGKKRKIIQVRFFGLIFKMREKKYSWQEISAYLAKYHKVKVNYSSISRYFREQVEKMEEAKK